MILSALIAATHYLALGIGLGSVFVRGRYLRRLRAAPADEQALKGLFSADTSWALAALLWVGTGLFRVFGGLDKDASYYARNTMFWMKMGLVIAVFIAEIGPMVTFIRWRIAQKRGALVMDRVRWRSLIFINDLQLALVVVIPIVASLMARGIGY